MAAGYIGVDIFFVLSGFLITNSLLNDLKYHGRIRYKHFWSRRIARLMPAALLTITAVLIWSWLRGTVYLRSATGEDAWFTVFYLANWHFTGAGSYFESDGTSSPLLHMWSLAVEEQFYLIWPILIGLTFFLLFRKTKSTDIFKARGTLLPVSVIVIAISMALMVALHGQSTDRAYMGTDTKAFEPMIGAFAAIIASDDRAKKFFTRFSRPMIWSGAVLIVALFVVLDGPPKFYFVGGAALFSVASALLILGIRYGLEHPESKVLAWQPVSYLGRISYGLYLWHWPWAVWLLNPAKGFEPAKSLLVIVLTVATAAASYHLVEMPIREGAIAKLLTETKTICFGITSMLVVALFAGVTGGTPISKPIFKVVYGTELHDDTIMLVGDSVPRRLTPVLTKVAANQGITVVNGSLGGCSPLGTDIIADPKNPEHSPCHKAIDLQMETKEIYRPGYILWWSRHEIIDRYQGEKILSPDSEEFWQAQEEDFGAAAERLTADGAKLVVILTERPGLGTLNRPENQLNSAIVQYMMNHDDYRQRFNSIIERVASENDKIFLINGDPLFCEAGPTGRTDSLCDDSIDGNYIRYDGSHVNVDIFGELVSRRLLESVAEATKD